MHHFFDNRTQTGCGFVLLVGLMSGCYTAPKLVEADRFAPPYTVTIFDKGGPVGERTIDAGSKEADMIQTWLKSNNSGWKSTNVTYAPNALISGNSFTLNFGSNSCIVNDPHGQFMKHADTSSLKAIFAKPTSD